MNRPEEFWSQNKRCYLARNSKGNNCHSVPSLVRHIWKNRDHAVLRGKLNPGGFVFKFKTTSQKEIHEISKKLKRKKSPGYDDISVSMIFIGAEQISGLLSN